jgi:TRAP-type uncharacterized transport system substrate-binding protein
MSKRWLMLIGAVCLGAAGTSQAGPLEPPDVAYIDGPPCGSACQSQMARSLARTPTSAPHARAQPARRPANRAAAAAVAAEQIAATNAVADPKTNGHGRSGRAETAQRGDTGKTTLAAADDTSHLVALVMARPEIRSVSDLADKNIAIDDRQSASGADVRSAIAAAGAKEVQLSKSQTKAIDRLIGGEVPAAVLTLAYPEAAEWSPEIAGFRIFRIPLSPRSLQARLEPEGGAAAKSETKSDAKIDAKSDKSDAKPDATPVATPAKNAETPAKADAAPTPRARTLPEQVAAAVALAEQVTAAAAADDANNAGRSEPVQPGADKTAAMPSGNTDHLVALLMARSDIKSVAALDGKDIAIDDRQSASIRVVRNAITAAGAVAAELSEGHVKAIDRLIGGEVQAAVLALVSPDAAEWFPDIAGFKVFRIPLSPRSLQARLETAGKVATRSDATPAKPAEPPVKVDAAAKSITRAIQEQVAAATELAEHVTAATGKPGSTPPANADLVALVMVRSETKSVSDLAGKAIAIEDSRSASSTIVGTAIAAAGAVEAKLSEGHGKAVDRLIGGEVPAAVLTLVSPEAAEWFPEIPGFRVFRIPLSPRSVKAKL